MDVRFVEPFVAAAFSVIQAVTNEKCERGPLTLRNAATFTSQELSVVIGVSGRVAGVAVYGLSRSTALKIASAMTGERVVELTEEALSAIGELGNMMSGAATTSLSENGYECNISPPSLIRGFGVQTTTVSPALLIPVKTRLGRIDINIALAVGAGGACHRWSPRGRASHPPHIPRRWCAGSFGAPKRGAVVASLLLN